MVRGVMVMVVRWGWRRGASVLAVALLVAGVSVPVLAGVAAAVGTVGSATSLSVDTTTAVVGAPVTLTSSVAGGGGGAGGTVAGKVTFKRGTTVLATVSLAGGSASLTTTKLPLGTWSLTATFTGSSVYAVSVSAPVSVTVSKSVTTTVLRENPVTPANHVAGAPVTLTADVSVPGSPGVVAAGKVTFKNNATVLATVALSGGSASFTSSKLPVGALSLTATYVGSTTLATSVSSVLGLSEAKADTSVSLVTTDLVPTVGESVTLRAYVSAVAPSTEPVTGSVKLTSNGITLGTVAVSGGVAKLVTTKLHAGPISATAVYSGSARLNPTASSAVKQATLASVTGSGSSEIGEPVDLTATIKAAGVGNTPPAGVSIFRDGATVLGTATVAGGQATLTVSSLSLGDHPISVDFDGGTQFGSSTSSAFIQHVGQGTTVITVTGPCCDVSGQAATFTARVSAASPAAGAPTGNVTFTATADDGASPAIDLGAVPLVNGQAQQSGPLYRDSGNTGVNPLFGARDFTVHATYSGDTDFTGSSAGATLAITNGDTTAAVTASPPSTNVGDDVTVTATIAPVTPAAGTPTGTVTFTSGATTIGTVAISNGAATLDTTALPAGTDTITATYNGDTNFNPSTATGTETVAGPSSLPVAVTVFADHDPARPGDEVTFTATIAAQTGGHSPTGTVSFTDGTTTLGTTGLAAVHDPVSSAVVSTSFATLGAHTITAIYSGDATYRVTTATVEQDINVVSTTAVAADSATSEPGADVTFTATVAASATQSPTGTVTFADGAAVIDTAALTPLDLQHSTATITTKALGPGAHTITALYDGDAVTIGSMASITHAVNGPPAAPTAIAATVDTNGAATIIWTPGPDGGAPITNYDLAAFRDGVLTGYPNITTPNYRLVVDFGHTYTFQVVACNHYGCSPYSTTSAPLVVPAATGLTISPPFPVDFGSVPAGNTGAARTFTVTNNTSFPAGWAANDNDWSPDHFVDIGGGTCSDNSSPANILFPGDSCTIVVSPLGFVSDVGSTITGNVVEDFKLIQNGLVDISVSTPQLAATITPPYTINPTSTLGFGAVPAGAIAATRTFTMTNNTSFASSRTSISSSGHFADVGGTCSGTVAAGGSCTIIVAPLGLPGDVGNTISGAVTESFSPNDPVAGLLGFPASVATPLLSATITSALAISDSGTYDFGAVAVPGGPPSHTFTVTNSTSYPVTFTSPTTSGHFTGAGTCAGFAAVGLASGATCTIIATPVPQLADVGTTIAGSVSYGFAWTPLGGGPVSATISAQLHAEPFAKNCALAPAPGVDLSYCDLHTWNYTNQDLTGANLSYANLNGATVTFTKFNGANLTGVTARGTSFIVSNFTNAAATGIDLTGANIYAATITGADLSHAKLGVSRYGSNAGMDTANLRYADFTGSGWVFYQGQLPGPTVFVGKDLTGTILASTDLSGVQFTNTNVAGADFTNSNLTNATFVGATGTNTAAGLIDPTDVGAHRRFNASLAGSDFVGRLHDFGANSSVKQMIFTGLDFSYTNFNNATLYGADFTGANLAHSTLVSADATGAKFGHADMSYVDFTNAYLVNSSLTTSVLTGVTWNNTTCPTGALSDTHGHTCIGYL